MNAAAAKVLVLMRDATGSPGRVSAYVPDTTPAAAALAAADALAAAVSAVSGCVVTGYSVTYDTVLSDERPGASDASSVLRLVFEAEGGAYAAVDVAGLIPALVGEDGTAVDASTGPVAALAAALVSGPWTNPFGQGLTALIASYREVQP